MDTAELFGCWLMDYLTIEQGEVLSEQIDKWEVRVRKYLQEKGHLEQFDQSGKVIENPL